MLGIVWPPCFFHHPIMMTHRQKVCVKPFSCLRLPLQLFWTNWIHDACLLLFLSSIQYVSVSWSRIMFSPEARPFSHPVLHYAQDVLVGYRGSGKGWWPMDEEDPLGCNLTPQRHDPLPINHWKHEIMLIPCTQPELTCKCSRVRDYQTFHCQGLYRGQWNVSFTILKAWSWEGF